jgi:hypothetical protein
VDFGDRSEEFGRALAAMEQAAANARVERKVILKDP